jgi:hypothetical protein
VSRPGGQVRGEVACGVKSPGATIAGYQAPTKEASWGRAWSVKPQGLNKKFRLGIICCCEDGNEPSDSMKGRNCFAVCVCVWGGDSESYLQKNGVLIF